MKTIAVIFTLILKMNFCFANEIDELNTLKDVKKFLKKVHKVVAYESIFDSTGYYRKKDYDNKTFYNKQPFIKADINSDGLTDLIINGNYLFVVFDKGDHTFEAKYIDGNIDYNLLKIIYIEKTPLLTVRKFYRYSSSPDIDTLIFKFDGFVEYNASPDNLKIQKIEFTTTGYGPHTLFAKPSPAFTLNVNPEQTATYYNYGEENKIFKATIDSAFFNNLIELINYIKLDKLKTEYGYRLTKDGYKVIDVTDAATFTLKIKFNNTEKQIEDYGQRSTLGLIKLYALLYKLHDMQEWKEYHP